MMLPLPLRIGSESELRPFNGICTTSGVKCGLLPETLLTLRPTGLPFFVGDCGIRQDRVDKRFRSNPSKLVKLGSRDRFGEFFVSVPQFELISLLLFRRKMREKKPCFFCGDDWAELFVLDAGDRFSGERLIMIFGSSRC